LWGFGALAEADLARALADPDGHVRAEGAKLAEPWLAACPRLRERLLALSADPDLHVRFQVAFSLGEIHDPAIAAPLAAILRRDAADPWITAAALSSAGDVGDRLLGALLSDSAFTQKPASVEVLRQIAAFVGARNRPDELARAFAALPKEGRSAAVLAAISGLGEGLKRAGKTLRQSAAHEPGIISLLEAAHATARDAQAAPERRIEALALLGFDDFAPLKETVTPLLDQRQPQDVQRAAITAIAGSNRPEVAALLMERWPTYSPATRTQVIEAMLAAQSRLRPLLDAIESGQVPAHEIPFARRAVLLRSRDPELAARAGRLFGPTATTSRAKAIESYRPALALHGDPARGAQVFGQICIACHRAGDTGTSNTGPNLASIRQWSPEQVLINILDPNREVAPNYVQYAIETSDGRSAVGIISEETPAALTVRRADGTDETVLREHIKSITSLNISMMPEGLEAAIPIPAMADLLAFLLGS
jgi:putative heme-binding domain-containing protein